MDKTLSDEYLIIMLRKDGEQAMSLIFKEFYGYLLRVILRMLPDKQAAEDLVQDVFYDFWRKRDSLDISISLRAYLRRSAINKTLNYFRDKKIKWDDDTELPLLENQSPNASQILEGQEMKAIIETAIDNLPDRCRVIFSLSRFEEMTYQEIADQLGISIKTVENQMTKALRVLRAAVGSWQ